MMRWLFILMWLLPDIGSAQPSDFLLLKKKDKTVQSFYAGTQMEVETISGAYRNALINRIAHDTVFLQEFLIRRIPTQLGFFITDTAGSFRYAYHYKEISRFVKKQKGFNVSGSGAALLGGGILLTLANAVVFLADRKKFSLGFMLTSAGLGIVGYFLSKVGSKGIVVGKNNYRLEYISVTKEGEL